MIVTDPAITRETFEKIARQWLSIARYHENALIINSLGDHFYTIPQILHDVGLLRLVLQDSYDKTIFVYVDSHVCNTLVNIQQEIIKALEDQRGVCVVNPSAMTFKDTIDYVHKKGLFLVFLFVHTEKLFTHHETLLFELEKISRLRHITCLYFAEVNMTNPLYSDKISSCPSLYQNIFYMPLYSKKDISYFVALHKKKWHIDLPKDVQDYIERMCGSNLWLLKHCLRSYRNNPENTTCDNICSDLAFKTKSRQVWDQLHADEKTVVRKAVMGKKIEDDNEILLLDFLIRINYLTLSDKNTYTLNIQALTPYVLEKKGYSGLSIDDKHIYYDGKLISEDLTTSEFKIFYTLLKDSDGWVQRDKLAEVLWPGSNGNYSDWALDRTVSRLRNKLALHNLPELLIKTKKGVGYSVGRSSY